MDYLRSCYEVDMVFRVGDPPIKVRWYFVDCNHNNHPLWTPFASANWVSRVCEAGALGEQPGSRPWANGSRPVNAGDGDEVAVACVEEHEEWWTDGIGSGEETGPYDDAGLPICCTEVPPPVSPCDDCSGLPDDLVITFASVDCPCIDGASWPLTWEPVGGVWVINGIQVCDCTPPNFGAITLSKIVDSPTCTLQLDLGVLFCGGGGLPQADALCDEAGTLVSVTFAGFLTLSTGACTGGAYSATVVPA